MSERIGEFGSVVGSNSTVGSAGQSDGSTRSANWSGGSVGGTSGSTESESGGGSSSGVNSPPLKTESFTSPVENLKPPKMEELQSLAILTSYLTHKGQLSILETHTQSRTHFLNSENDDIGAAKEALNRARMQVREAKDVAKRAVNQEEALKKAAVRLIQAIEEEFKLNEKLSNRMKLVEDTKGLLARDEKRMADLARTMDSEKAKLMAFKTIGVSRTEHIIEIRENLCFKDVRSFAIIPPIGSDDSVRVDLEAEAVQTGRTIERRAPARPPTPPDEVPFDDLGLTWQWIPWT